MSKLDEKIPLFMDITSVSDSNIASNFLEMAGGDLETAVSLYFEHGVGASTDPSSNSNADIVNLSDDYEGDAELANKLQQEMYADSNQNDEVRQPIMPTRDTLLPQEYGFGGAFGSLHSGVGSQGGMFGRSQQSVFNQTINGTIVLDSDDDNDENNDDFNNDGYGGFGNSAMGNRSKMTSTQKRLATIFRPPWDIISKVDFDSAKKMARQENKWILINIQDVTDFRCQCLNRDFWSSNQIKQLIEKNFIFLQYQHDSPSGEIYRNLYPFNDEYPHIAILDPITGERMIIWNTNPEIHKFIEQVVDFLNKYNVDGSTTTTLIPTSTGLNKDHAIEIDESEDEKHQKSNDTEEMDDNDEELSEIEHSFDVEEENEGETEQKELSYTDKIKLLKAIDLADPPIDTDPTLLTRIQIRSGIDGGRVVKKFLINDSVEKLFQFVKFTFANSLNDHPFTLKMQRTNLMDYMDKTIAEAQLKNASVLLEVLDEED